MTLIIKCNYFLEKQRQRMQVEQEAEKHTLNVDQEAFFAQARASLESQRYMPDYQGRRAFKYAAKSAPAIAERYEMDVEVTRYEHCGYIAFTCDELLSDREWRDGRKKCCLLRLIRMADSVDISALDSSGLPLLSIGLSYQFFRRRAAGRQR